MAAVLGLFGSALGLVTASLAFALCGASLFASSAIWIGIGITFLLFGLTQMMPSPQRRYDLAVQERA